MASGKADRRPGEFELIAELFAPLSQNAPGAFGLTDDAAVLAPPPGHELVLKTDAIVEGVHFFRTDPPSDVARKALRVNLSDLAAKGAVPAGYLMALLLPDWPDMAWLRAFADGLAADQAAFGLSLMGGDTSTTPGPLAISISAFGHVPAGAMIRRAGARPGDLVFVSGTIGDAGGGLAVLKENKSAPELVVRYRVPEPRLTLGPALRGIASASLDVSKLKYQMPGAQVDLDGTYSLDGQKFAFDGTVRTQATASQMLTGWKSILAMPFDPLLKKNGAGLEVPIKIDGTRSDPKFGIQFDKLGKQIMSRHKDKDAQPPAPKQ